MKKIIVLMLGIMLFFIGCGKNTSQSKNNSDTLRVCLSEDAKNIDTVQINDDYSAVSYTHLTLPTKLEV